MELVRGNKLLMKAHTPLGILDRINHTRKSSFLVARPEGRYGFLRHMLYLFDFTMNGVFAKDRVVLAELQAIRSVFAVFPCVIPRSAWQPTCGMLCAFQDDLNAIALLFRHTAKVRITLYFAGLGSIGEKVLLLLHAAPTSSCMAGRHEPVGSADG